MSAFLIFIGNFVENSFEKLDGYYFIEYLLKVAGLDGLRDVPDELREGGVTMRQRYFLRWEKLTEKAYLQKRMTFLRVDSMSLSLRMVSMVYFMWRS